MGNWMISLRPGIVTTFGAAGLMLFANSAALAQQGDAAETASETEDDTSLEEVVVTSRRRAESLQDVPLAVTALGADVLEQQQVVDSKGLSFAVPNLLVGQLTSNTTAAIIFLRGIGQDDSTPVSEPGVAIYVDDVYMPRSQGGLMDLLDMDRVEVLRGPQGTLYGRNSTGGAIRYITRKPSLNDVEAKGEITVGRFDRTDARATFGAPIVDGRLAAKLDLSYRKQDGYMRRVTNGERLNGLDRQVARLAMRWAPSDVVMVDLSADYSRDRSDIYVGTPLTNGPGPFNRVPLYGDPYITGAGAENLNRYDGWGLSGTVTWDLGATELKSVTSYRGFDQKFWGDLSSSPPTLFDDIFRDLEQYHLTQELQWSSRSEGRWQWVVGAFYMHEDWENLDLVLSVHDSEQQTESAAVFGEASYDLTEQLSVTLGSRFTYDKKDYSVDAVSLIGVPFSAGRSKSWTNYSPKVALDYQLTDDLLIYGSWRSGYKVGAFQNFPQGVVDVVDQVQKPEDVNVYEVGFKSDWLDHRVRVNLAAFYSNYDDIQFQVFENLNFLARNAGARIYGTELEVSARPTSNLTLRGFVSTLDTKITDVPEGVTGLPAVGSRLRFSPELQGKVGFDYEWPMSGGGKLFLGSNYTWVDEIYFDVFNLPFANQEQFDLIDARLGFESDGGRWRVELGGKNLGNEEYALLIQPFGGQTTDGTAGGARHYEAPRTWFLSLMMQL